MHSRLNIGLFYSAKKISYKKGTNNKYALSLTFFKIFFKRLPSQYYIFSIKGQQKPNSLSFS